MIRKEQRRNNNKEQIMIIMNKFIKINRRGDEKKGWPAVRWEILRDHTCQFIGKNHFTNSPICSVIGHGHFAFPSQFIGTTFIGATSYFSKHKIQRPCLRGLIIAPWLVCRGVGIPCMQFPVLVSGAYEGEIPMSGKFMFTVWHRNLSASMASLWPSHLG